MATQKLTYPSLPSINQDSFTERCLIRFYSYLLRNWAEIKVYCLCACPGFRCTSQKLNRTSEKLGCTSQKFGRTYKKLQCTSQKLRRTGDKLERTSQKFGRTYKKLQCTRQKLRRTNRNFCFPNKS